jgi:AcrR family transcriptional regulator
MLRAVAEAVAEKGWPHMTVADVISRAGVSRETFYEHFSAKEDCFLAALDEGARTLHEILVSTVARSGDDPTERLREMLKAYLNTLAAEPAFAKAFLIDAYGAGPAATERRLNLQQRFIDLVAEISGGAADRFACEAFVAAISAMVTSRVGRGRINELPALRDPMVGLAGRLLGIEG